MPEYIANKREEFTGLEDSSGVIYHQRGNYSLGGEDELIPVNRSYRPIDSAYSGSNQRRSGNYVYDKLIHDTIPEDKSLLVPERRIQVLGKSLLFLDISSSTTIVREFSSRYEQNPAASPEARSTLEALKNGLNKRGYGPTLGVHGSHEVGLNGVDSDIDLIAWSKREERQEVLTAIEDTLLDRGYTHANNTPNFQEYAVRISNLTGLPNKIGAFLAKQRNRWTSPGGTPTSLQLIHSDYDHQKAKVLIDTALQGNAENTGDVSNLPVEILDGSEPFNYPRYWAIDDGETEANVLSFNMVHQGMGTDGRSAKASSEEHLMSAQKWVTAQGETLYFMQDDHSYILPSYLLHR